MAPSQDMACATPAAALRRRSFATQPLHPQHPAKRLLDALPDFFARAASAEGSAATPQAIVASGLEARGHVQLASDKRVYVVRDSRDLPAELPIAQAWQALFDLSLRYLADIEQDTGWPQGTLASLVGGTALLPGAPVETLMRLFCYTERASKDDVCRLEPHVDKGLLTLVLSTRKGLGVVDAQDGSWCTPRVRSRYRRRPVLSVLVGETLQYVSNHRFTTCMHGVTAGLQRRYAVVFQLRPAFEACIDSDILTTPRTGPYVPPIHERVETWEARHFAHARSVNYTE